MENLRILVRFEDVGEVLTVGVGNEDLAESLTLYHLHNAFYPFAIQPVKYIV